MTQIFFKHLKQTPVNIVISNCLYAIWNKLTQKEKEAISERKTHKKELQSLNDKQAEELKELNHYIRENEKLQLEALDKISDALKKK